MFQTLSNFQPHCLWTKASLAPARTSEDPYLSPALSRFIKPNWGQFGWIQNDSSSAMSEYLDHGGNQSLVPSLDLLEPMWISTIQFTDFVPTNNTWKLNIFNSNIFNSTGSNMILLIKKTPEFLLVTTFSSKPSHCPMNCVEYLEKTPPDASCRCKYLVYVHHLGKEHPTLTETIV